MIQTYFQRGVRLRWNKRSDLNAVMAPKGGFLNQDPINDYLTLEGLDIQVKHESDQFGLKALYKADPGPHRKGKVVNHNWLNYAPGFITRTPLVGDTLTGYMSGCLIVTWRDTTSPHRYMGHIGTDVNNLEATRAVKHNFVRFMPPASVKGYDPSAAWSVAERGEANARKVEKNLYTRPAEVVSLVTQHGHFYSILLFPIKDQQQSGNASNTLFVVGGIRQVQPLDYTGLRAILTR